MKTYNSGALALNNSNIDGVNAIYMADYSNNAAEGIHFYRDTTHVDSLHAASGTLYLTPNRQLGTDGTPIPILTRASSPIYMTTNTFDLNGKPYISKIDNGLYLADKRFTVTCTRTNSDSTTTTLSPSVLFDGVYGTGTAITALEGETINLNFDFGSNGFPGGYCDGYIILTFYNYGLPKSVSGRAYFDWNSVGWRNITFSQLANTKSYRGGLPYTYKMTQLELTIEGQTLTGDPKKTMLVEVEYQMLRPSTGGLSPFISKYSSEKIYYNLVSVSPNTGFFVDNGLTGNDHKLVGLYQNSAGTLSGLYDSVKSKWLVNTDGTDYKYNGHTINADVPSGAKFTDTVTTATTSGSGNAVTAITATNGALTVTKGTTFLTSHQDISGKADKSTTVTNVAYDGTKLTKTINGTTSDVVTVLNLRRDLNIPDAVDISYDSTNKKIIKTVNGTPADVVTVATLTSGLVPTTRKVNNKALSADITLSASDVSAVPTTRKVNNKELSSDITLTASDVGAVSTVSTTHNGCLAKFYSDGVLLDGPTLGSSTTTFLRNDGTWATPPSSGSIPNDYLKGTGLANACLTIENGDGTIDSDVVTADRRINNKNLYNDITLSASDVGALSSMSYTTVTTTSKSVSSSTSYSTFKGVQVAPGLHFFQASCSFPQSSNANRRGGLRLVSGSGTTAIAGMETKLTLSNNGETMAHISGWVQPTSTTTYNFQVFQNSGAALTLELVGRYHTLA